MDYITFATTLIRLSPQVHQSMQQVDVCDIKS